jgi:hypothetical protein
MIYLKTFENLLDDYPYFEINADEYSLAINSNSHINLNDRDINNLMNIILSTNRSLWYKNTDGYVIKVIYSEFLTKVMFIFKTDDDYFYIWTYNDRFFKCDDIEGFKKFSKENPQLFGF